MALDAYAASLGAIYSTRRAVASYTGPLLRARRSSDGAETDVYPDAEGYVSLSSDTGTAGSGTSLGTWCGANSATVPTWYDQLETEDAYQATASLQWRLVTAGVLEVATNGRAGLLSHGSTYMKSDLPRAQPDAAFVLARTREFGGASNPFVLDGKVSSQRRLLGAVYATSEAALAVSAVLAHGTAPDGTQTYVYYGLFNGASSVVGRGSGYTTGNGGTGDAPSGVVLGNAYEGSGGANNYKTDGHLQEYVFYEGAPSDADRNAIRDDIAAFVGYVDAAADVVAVPAGDATSSGWAPTVGAGAVIVSAPEGQASASGWSPTVSASGVDVAAPEGQASASGWSPTVAAGAVRVVAPSGGATSSGWSPSVSGRTPADNVAAPEGQAEATGWSPTVAAGAVSVGAPSGEAMSSGWSPRVTAAGVLGVPEGQTVASGWSPAAVAADVVAVPAGQSEASGWAPTIGAGAVRVTVPVGEASASGWSPTVTEGIEFGAAPAWRTLVVAAEQRTFAIAAEERTFIVAADN